ncbi:fimbrial protein [Entomohabitans teleogrylli]|uniref:fimbrial protein n=1 Tax=Entomohabitans teleogrylli TaxID=1384589 RepID=UPI00073D795C|nr:fimbrial protein [Entomohabitans teleogrylli]
MNLIAKLSTMMILLLLPAVGYARCNFVDGITSEVSVEVNFGNIIVQRDAAVGTVIGTANTGDFNNGRSIAGCDVPWTFAWEIRQWRTLSSSGNNIYNTNIPGVGIRLVMGTSGRHLPFQIDFPALNYPILSNVRVELIKTGNISGGTLTPGMLAQAVIVNQFPMANIRLTGTNTVSAAACSVTTPGVNVAMGDHDKREFRGLGTGTGTGWTRFNISLNCNRNARINVRIDATPDPINRPGVMRLDRAPGNMAATGVGIELWYQHINVPVQFGQERFYYQSPSGGNEIVQLQARYYQTGATITAGKANATATFTLTYK